MSTYARGLYHRNVTRIVSLDSIRNLFKFLQAQEDCWAPSVLYHTGESLELPSMVWYSGIEL